MPVYINGLFLKKTKFGIKMQGKADDVIEQILENKKENGYFKFEIKERKEPDKNGNTHYVVLDTFEPTAKPAGKEDTTTDLPF
jgi:hypothetical protein